MSRKPVDQLDAGRAYYARHLPEIDADHFGVLWHLFTVGHLVIADLDHVARGMACSFADLDFLGTLTVDEPKSMRATDLASTLYLSNAAISTRVRRLLAAGLIRRERAPDDRRAFALRLTAAGRALIEEAVPAIARDAKIVRFFRQLPAEDRRHLVRILGDLHQRFDREFVGTPYEDG